MDGCTLRKWYEKVPSNCNYFYKRKYESIKTVKVISMKRMYLSFVRKKWLEI